MLVTYTSQLPSRAMGRSPEENFIRLEEIAEKRCKGHPERFAKTRDRYFNTWMRYVAQHS